MFRSIARDKNNSFPKNLCQIIAFKLLEDVTKNQFVQSPVTLVINIQSQNEYKCTQDVFRVLKKSLYKLLSGVAMVSKLSPPYSP